MLNTLRHQYLAILWGIFIIVLCSMPLPQVKSVSFFEGFDKLVHVGVFFVLTAFLFLGTIRQHYTDGFRLISAVKIVSASVIFGGFIEIIQKELFTYRSAELWDFFADVVGIGMAVFSYILLHRTRLKTNESIN